MAGNFIKSWQAEVGLNHVPAYQTSGRPFASASVVYDDAPRAVHLPYVTRWWQIHNRGASDLRVGFSAHGLTGSSGNYYFIVPPSGSTGFGKSDIYNKTIENFIVDGQKFINDTKWNPPVSPLKGIKKTCLWYKRRFNIS